MPDPASLNEETEAILDADQPTQQTSTEDFDEDPNEEVVNDPDVLAEVILASIVRKFNFESLHFLVASKCML